MLIVSVFWTFIADIFSRNQAKRKRSTEHSMGGSY